jgi:hypothetical protein
LSNMVRRKVWSFEEYWLASKAWERRGLTLGTGRALVNAGFANVEDLQTAEDLELASIPRVGPKSLAIIYRLMERKMPTVPRKRVRRPLNGFPLRKPATLKGRN